MDLRRIRHFVVLAETLNFRRAAERLHMAQPPLTVSIQKLEAELGTKLFERGAQGVSLTAIGRTVLVEARKLLFHGTPARCDRAGARSRAPAARCTSASWAPRRYGMLQKVVPRIPQRIPGRGADAARGDLGGHPAAAGGPQAGRRLVAHTTVADHRRDVDSAGARRIHRRLAPRPRPGRARAAAAGANSPPKPSSCTAPAPRRPAQRRHAGLPECGLHATRDAAGRAGADPRWRWWKAAWASLSCLPSCSATSATRSSTALCSTYRKARRWAWRSPTCRKPKVRRPHASAP